MVEIDKEGPDHTQASNDNSTASSINEEDLNTPAKQCEKTPTNQTQLSEYKGELTTLGDNILNKMDDELDDEQKLNNDTGSTPIQDDPRLDPEVDEWEKRDEMEASSNTPAPTDEDNPQPNHQQESNEESNLSDERKDLLHPKYILWRRRWGHTMGIERTRHGRSQAAETTASKTVNPTNEPTNSNTSSETFKSTRKK